MRLSAIDHNHHTSLKQAKDAMGNLLFTRRWSKKGGRWIPVKITEKKNYTYISSLLCNMIGKRMCDTLAMTRKVDLDERDPRRRARSVAKLPPQPTKELASKAKSRF